MALIISVARAADEKVLGDFESVEIIRGELRVTDSATVIAKHVHHRWLIDEAVPEAFERLEVIGPAFVFPIDGSATRLGPYGHFSVVNGVFYADRRVFGFVDVQHTDCYLGDLGAHCKGVRLSFNQRG